MELKNLHWLGHDSFRLGSEKIIYFDPYRLPKNSPKADIILITHDHYDHCSETDVKSISTKDAVILASLGAGEKLKESGVLCKEIMFLEPFKNAEIGGVKVFAVPSYNIGKPYHPKSAKNLGFIVEAEGSKIYHAGDTDKIPEMEDFHCDIALLPVGGTFTMNAQEASEAALVIKPKVAIPMHYGSGTGSKEDGERFAELLKGKIEVKILTKES
ncbi:MAG: MBL fold metallo-hydrolase [Candidatus Omnitrophica bacterium]|nr:MBL fold metallo-hydrolase [Candidatus Omnitrophota bacterium]